MPLTHIGPLALLIASAVAADDLATVIVVAIGVISGRIGSQTYSLTIGDRLGQNVGEGRLTVIRVSWRRPTNTG
jgi:hypothetical protein